jgi:hypothetical protein
MNTFVTHAEMERRREASRQRCLMLARLYVLKHHGTPLEATQAWGYSGA